jgi:hypothetical protein
MRSMQWLHEKKNPKRDAEVQKDLAEHKADSHDVCERSCQEMRSAPIRNIR